MSEEHQNIFHNCQSNRAGQTVVMRGNNTVASFSGLDLPSASGAPPCTSSIILQKTSKRNEEQCCVSWSGTAQNIFTFLLNFNRQVKFLFRRIFPIYKSEKTDFHTRENRFAGFLCSNVSTQNWTRTLPSTLNTHNVIRNTEVQETAHQLSFTRDSQGSWPLTLTLHSDRSHFRRSCYEDIVRRTSFSMV